MKESFETRKLNSNDIFEQIYMFRARRIRDAERGDLVGQT